MFGLFCRLSTFGQEHVRTAPRRRVSLQAEVLEERCTPTTVTNTMDSGPGSLRQEIANTAANGTVDFAPGVTGTITLTTGQITINKGLTITGPGAGVLSVSGNNSSSIFFISA